MIEFPLIVLGGLLGSTHCLGMCGPFALALGSTSSSWWANCRRQLIYTCGRICTYSFLGGTAAFVGHYATVRWPLLSNLPAVLALLAGVLLIYYGLSAAGWNLLPARKSGPVTCLGSTFFATFLTAPGARNAFLAGLFTGLLPCGLVYAFLTLAASSNHLLGGVVTMAAFGAGTAPAMILLGCGGSVLSPGARRQVMRFAGLCVVAGGVLSVLRGVGYANLPGWLAPTGCPLCGG